MLVEARKVPNATEDFFFLICIAMWSLRFSWNFAFDKKKLQHGVVSFGVVIAFGV